MTTGDLIKRLQALDPSGKLTVMVTTDEGRQVTARFAPHVYGVTGRREGHALAELDASIQKGQHRNYVLALRSERP